MNAVRPPRFPYADEALRHEMGMRPYICLVFEAMDWPRPLWWCFDRETLRLLVAEAIW